MTRVFGTIVLVICGVAPIANAEPYLAVQQGAKCVQCHVNPTGGGLRNAYGNAFSLTQLPSGTIDTGETTWLGKVNELIAIGGDLRAAGTVVEIPHNEDTFAFELQQVRLYGDISVIAKRLAIYVDQLIAPGAAINREAYARLHSRGGGWYLKAGRMYLPFGLRLQDDSAFVRQTAGINMTTPDSGVEGGMELGSWSAQFAISNGSAGGAETNTGKQYSLQGVFTGSHGRIGAGLNLNDAIASDRQAFAVFAGLRTGPISWLVEVDYVIDENGVQIAGATARDRKRIAGLLEGNWLVTQGHNLKLTAESLDPDREIDEDEQARLSGVYEYSPIQFLQLRGGMRYYDGIPQNDPQNRTVYFLELHGFY